MELKPVHTHDCDKCRLLGSVTTKIGPVADLYACDSGSIVARYSSDGPDYTSIPRGMMELTQNRELLIAGVLAGIKPIR